VQPFINPKRRGSYCAHAHGLRPNLDQCLGGHHSVEGTVIPTDEAIIAEALETNHAGIGSERTLATYRAHVAHYAQYLASAKGATIATAKRKHVLAFMHHLEQRGGSKPHPFREPCGWCADRAYPDGRSGHGWSASRRKSYFAAIRFVYRHMIEEDYLPSIDPTWNMSAPKVTVRRGYTPSRGEIKMLLDADGSPRDRLLAYWAY